MNTKINDFPIIKVNEDTLQLKVSLQLYTPDAINAVCYQYTGKCYVHQEFLPEDQTVLVTIQSKDGSTISIDKGKQFCNNLIDQQLRYVTEHQFGHIRDLIVEEAFKPVRKQY